MKQASVSSLPPASWAFMHCLNPTSTCPLLALFIPTLPPGPQEHVCDLHTHAHTHTYMAHLHIHTHTTPQLGIRLLSGV